MTSTCQITVRRDERGRWAVCESGFEAAIADFDEREDAIEYARGIASTKPRASIDAESMNDLPAVRESYALDPVSGKGARLSV